MSYTNLGNGYWRFSKIFFGEPYKASQDSWARAWRFPRDLYVRYGVWGLDLILTRKVDFRVALHVGHSYLEFFYFTFQLAYWRFSARIVEPFRGFRTGGIDGQNYSQDLPKIREWIEGNR